MTSETRRWTRLLALPLAGAMALAACGGVSSFEDADEGSSEGTLTGLSGTINITGSSTVEPVSVILGENFSDETGGTVVVNVDGPGTGDGFELFCNGDAPITGASRKIKGAEIESCEASGVEYAELEIAFDGLTVMTNPANDAVECLTLEDLYALVGPEATGISRWADAAKVAAELGSTTALPDIPLKVFGPGAESGTYDAFHELALKDPAKVRVEAGAITEKQAEATRSDYQASADDRVIVQGVLGAPTSLGWTGFAFAEAEGDAIREVAVAADDGTCVEPSTETIADGSYPLSRSLYLYVNRKAAEESEAVRAFVDFTFVNLKRAVERAGYVPLPAGRLAESREAWNN